MKSSILKVKQDSHPTVPLIKTVTTGPTASERGSAATSGPIATTGATASTGPTVTTNLIATTSATATTNAIVTTGPQVTTAPQVQDSSVALEPTTVTSDVEVSDAGSAFGSQSPLPKSSSDSESKFYLTYFDSALLASVLEDTLSSIRILSECNTQMRIQKTKVDMPMLLDQRLGVQPSPYRDELGDINVLKLECDEYKLKKLDDDRIYLLNVVTNAYEELCLHQECNNLLKFVNQHDEERHYRIRLIEDEVKYKAQLRDLKRQLRLQRNYFKSTVYEYTVRIEDLFLKLESSNEDMEVRSRFVGRWQQSRTEQHQETLRKQESYRLDNIIQHKHLVDQEQRVHSEMDLIVHLLINESLQEIENWMDKYDKDTEVMARDIEIKKLHYQEMLAKRMHLEAKIAKHETEMKNWQKFKKEREEKRIYEAHMHKCAVTVQAWWRGLIVRLQLGPYKPKRKRGGRRKSKT